MDTGIGDEAAIQGVVVLGVIAAVGEHDADAGHNGESGQEQALEHNCVIDVGRGRHACDRHAVAGDRDVVLGALLAAFGGVGPGKLAVALGPHRAAVKNQGRIATQHRHEQGVHLSQQARMRPAFKRTCKPQRWAFARPARRQASSTHGSCETVSKCS